MQVVLLVCGTQRSAVLGPWLAHHRRGRARKPVRRYLPGEPSLRPSLQVCRHHPSVTCTGSSIPACAAGWTSICPPQYGGATIACGLRRRVHPDLRALLIELNAREGVRDAYVFIKLPASDVGILIQQSFSRPRFPCPLKLLKIYNMS